MMKRTVLSLAAVAAIATPTLVAPALFTPANAQASMNIGISVPGPAPLYPAPSYGYVGGPVYANAWGEGWHRWDGGWHRGWNRGWERHEWREHAWRGHRDWDRGHHWGHGDWGHHGWR